MNNSSNSFVLLFFNVMLCFCLLFVFMPFYKLLKGLIHVFLIDLKETLVCARLPDVSTGANQQLPVLCVSVVTDVNPTDPIA